MPRQGPWTKAYWRYFSLDIRRVRRDKAAVLRIVFRLFWLTYVCAYLYGIGHAIYGTHDAATYWLIALLSAIVAVPVIGLRVSAALDDRRSSAEDRNIVPSHIAARLGLIAHGLSCMIHRALSELWLKHHVLHDGFESRARRKLLDDAGSSGALHDLPRPARLLLLQPEESWSEATVGALLLWLDCLRRSRGASTLKRNSSISPKVNRAGVNLRKLTPRSQRDKHPCGRLGTSALNATKPMTTS